MELQIKNIGKIKNADVKLDGLTLIAGNNSTGKTTFSKVLYSVIKTYKKDGDFIKDAKKNIIRKIVKEIFQLARVYHNKIEYPFPEMEMHIDIFYDFHTEKNKKEIETEITYKVFINEFKSEKDFIDNIINSNDIGLFLNGKKDFLLSIKFKNEDFVNKLIEYLEEIYLIYSRKYFTKLINNSNSVADLLYNDYINNKNDKDDIFKFIIEDEFYFNFNNNTKIKLINNSILFNYNNEKIDTYNIKEIGINDITIVESPIILSFLGKLNSKGLISHNVDLLEKLKNANLKSLDTIDGLDTYEPPLNPKTNYYFGNKISEIIGGNFYLGVEGGSDPDYIDGNLGFYIKEKFNNDLLKGSYGEKNLGYTDISSGIKSFGVLQLLEQSGNLNKNDFIVLDEPEAHLHPEWQIKYAKLICELIKDKGVKVIINSHSPYMIEALNKFSKKIGINEKSNFYLTSENEDGTITFIDKTDKKDEIFTTLSEPFKKIMLM